MLTVLAHLLNFALSLLIWLIVGRFVLGLLVGRRENFITELFRRATEPVFQLVRRVVPAFISSAYIPFVTILALTALRFALLPALR